MKDVEEDEESSSKIWKECDVEMMISLRGEIFEERKETR